MPNESVPATTPTTVSATFDSWSFQVRSEGDGLHVFGAAAGSPQPPIRFVAQGVKFRTRDDGVQERSPLPGDTVTLVIPDLYAAAAEKPYVAQALQALMAAVVEYGKETGQL